MSENCNKYLVTAIVSTYNSEKFIKGKIDDLLAQTIAEKLEIIIINSGSMQKEDEIVKPYLDKYSQIKYVKTAERETIYKAWNRGAKAASGKYITNSNTDDRLRKDAYEIMASALDNNPEAALVYANQVISIKENENYENVLREHEISFPEFDMIKMMDKCLIGSQPMWRASIHSTDNIWFDESFEVCGDHDFELSIAWNYKVIHLNQVLGTFYKSPLRSNKEYENVERNIKEIHRIRDKHINIFMNSVSPDIISRELFRIKKYSLIPFTFYILFTKILDGIFKKNLYRPVLFHTLEFIVLFYSAACRKLNKPDEARKFENRYHTFISFKERIKSKIKIKNE